MIDLVTYGPISKGISHGIFAVKFNFAEGKGSPEDIEEIISTVEKKMPKSKVALLYGNIVREDNDFMSTLIYALQAKQFSVQADVYSKYVLPWFQLVQVLSLNIVEGIEQPVYPCTELVYHLLEGKDPLPNIPEQLTKRIPLWVTKHLRSPFPIVDAFLARGDNKYIWRYTEDVGIIHDDLLFSAKKESKEEATTNEVPQTE